MPLLPVPQLRARGLPRGWREPLRAYTPLLEPMSGAVEHEIRKRMRHGDSIDDVDLEVIERSGLSGDQKAALWLYAWSFVPRRKQRASAELHLRLVGLQG
jgi:hypothetical protein